jgi:hypothetical protein
MPTWGWLLICGGCFMAGGLAGLLAAALAAAAGSASRAEERRP